mgnify:CR=1 FL=1
MDLPIDFDFLSLGILTILSLLKSSFYWGLSYEWDSFGFTFCPYRAYSST